MRFSNLQDDACGVGLPHNRLPSDINDSMTAATGDTVPVNNRSTEEGCMVSNLPLLFANGHPTSLEKITLAQLERFVTFMVQCSLGHDTTEVIREPQWWPKEVTFSNPLIRPKKVNDNWMANLKKLVFRCYTYHRSEYLLRFCSYLARYPRQDLDYVNNWDSTTSLFHKSTGKLLVTFRNENMNYDKRYNNARKKLLSHSSSSSSSTSVNKSKQHQHAIMMVQPPTDDIYLCDNCDAEFIGLDKMKEHERVCYMQEHRSSSSRPVTPDLLITKPELQQNQFLEYFGLSSENNENHTVNHNQVDNRTNIALDVNVPTRTSNRVRGHVNFTRCPTIPFSSPAGLLLAKKSKTMTEETQQERLERIERHLMAPPLQNFCRPKWLDHVIDKDRWIVTYKPNRDKPADDYVHHYKFHSSKGKPMLSIRSQILYVTCRPLHIILTRLSKSQLHEMKDLLKYSSVVTKKHAKPGPASKTKFKQINPALKRKAPVDETDTTTMEDDETAFPVFTKKILNSSELAESNGKDSGTSANIITSNIIQSSSASTIPVIDLCSSDEEDGLSMCTSSDENRDPMNCTDNIVMKSLFRKLTPNKHCSKPYIYRDDTNDWLTDNILSNESENSAHKCRNNVLNACTRISPILRPAP